MSALPEPPERSTIAEVGFEPEPPTVGLRRGESRAPLKPGRSYAPPGKLKIPPRCMSAQWAMKGILALSKRTVVRCFVATKTLHVYCSRARRVNLTFFEYWSWATWAHTVGSHVLWSWATWASP